MTLVRAKQVGDVAVFFDGCSSPHKHDFAGYAVTVKDECSDVNGSPRYCSFGSLHPNATNNEAEFYGLIEALDVAERLLIGAVNSQERFNVHIKGDSRIVIDAYNRGRVRASNLQPLLERCLDYKHRWSNRITVTWCEREKNLAGHYIGRNRAVMKQKYLRGRLRKGSFAVGKLPL